MSMKDINGQDLPTIELEDSQELVIDLDKTADDPVRAFELRFDEEEAVRLENGDLTLDMPEVAPPADDVADKFMARIVGNPETETHVPESKFTILSLLPQKPAEIEITAELADDEPLDITAELVEDEQPAVDNPSQGDTMKAPQDESTEQGMMMAEQSTESKFVATDNDHVTLSEGKPADNTASETREDQPSSNTEDKPKVQEPSSKKVNRQPDDEYYAMMHSNWQGFSDLDDDQVFYYDHMMRYLHKGKAVRNARGGFDFRLGSSFCGLMTPYAITWNPASNQGGETLSCYHGAWGFCQNDADALIAMAALKGWKSINITGKPDKKDKIWLAVQKLNLEKYRNDCKDPDKNPTEDIIKGMAEYMQANYLPADNSKIWSELYKEWPGNKNRLSSTILRDHIKLALAEKEEEKFRATEKKLYAQGGEAEKALEQWKKLDDLEKAYKDAAQALDTAQKENKQSVEHLVKAANGAEAALRAEDNKEKPKLAPSQAQEQLEKVDEALKKFRGKNSPYGQAIKMREELEAAIVAAGGVVQSEVVAITNDQDVATKTSTSAPRVAAPQAAPAPK